MRYCMGNGYLEKMRSERADSVNAVYLQIVNSRHDFKNYVFCFYEGEDGKYYDMRIRRVFGDSFNTYKLDNKDRVLKLFDKLSRQNSYNKEACMMFFIDRDCKTSLTEDMEDVFETPCYSVENLYSQRDCLKRILQSEFGINSGDDDYDKVMCAFERLERLFNNNMLEYNALVYLRRKKTRSNSDFQFGSIKTSHLVHINFCEVVKATQYCERIDEIKKTLEFTCDEVEKTKNELREMGNWTLNFRGKNQLDFFVSFVKELKAKQKNDPKYFNACHNSVYINITRNRLSELSQYAVTPPELCTFLKSHKQKFAQLSCH